MTARLAILCPGQGGQHGGMFDLALADARGRDVLDSCDFPSRFGQPLAALLADEQYLFANRYAQALVAASSLAMWAMLKDDLPTPTLVAGYSIGELSAYGVAGALSVPQVVEAAVRRAEYMDACMLTEPQQGLLALSGIEVAVVRKQLQGQSAWIAIETGFDSMIIGGTQSTLTALQAQWQAAGARVSPLPVGIASHTPLMTAAQEPFSQLLKTLAWCTPQVKVVAGISGQLVDAVAPAQSNLSRQLAEPIQWSACMDTCAEQGITVALELGPGAALSRMLRERHPTIACRSMQDFRSSAGALRWLTAQLE